MGSCYVKYVFSIGHAMLSDSLPGHHWGLPKFACNTDLATYNIPFDSSLPKAMLGFFTIADPVSLAALQ